LKNSLGKRGGFLSEKGAKIDSGKLPRSRTRGQGNFRGRNGGTRKGEDQSENINPPPLGYSKGIAFGPKKGSPTGRKKNRTRAKGVCKRFALIGGRGGAAPGDVWGRKRKN